MLETELENDMVTCGAEIIQISVISMILGWRLRDLLPSNR